VSDKKFQDVRLFSRLRCDDTCDAGILFRAEKTSDGGLHGIYVSISGKDLDCYELWTDANGKETKRTKLAPPPVESIGISGPAGGGPAAPAPPPRPPQNGLSGAGR
jgi:hypothetical protein